MTTAKPGDRVRVQYARVPRSRSTSARPARMIEFIVGGHTVMRGLSLGVVGMTQGDDKRLQLDPEEAYGPANERLIREIPRVRLPQHLALRVGSRLTAVLKSTGRRRMVRVVELKPDSVVVDGNHRLAGEAITLDITLISVDSSAEANRSKPQFDAGGEG
jgi:FKBP-type peptidyl-prolyl cis-trans isomerase 2